MANQEIDVQNQSIIKVGSDRTTDDYYLQDSDRKNSQNLSGLFKGLAVAGGTYGAIKLASNISFKDTAKTDKSYFTFLNMTSSKNLGGKVFNSRGDRKFDTFKVDGRLTGGEAILETIRKIEEYSPGKVGRTFQLSGLLAPSLTSKNTRVHFKGSDVKANLGLYRELFAKEGNGIGADEAIRNGFVLENNKLYLADSAGKSIKDRIILNEARLNFPYFKVPGVDKETGEVKEQLYRNKVMENYARIYGSEFDINNSHAKGNLSFSIIGGKSKARLNTQYMRAFARTVFQRGFETLDKPLGFLDELFPENKFIERLSEVKFNLGTSGQYNLGVRESLGIWGKNVGSKLALGGVAYYGLDSLLRKYAPDDSYFSNGIWAGLSAVYGSAHIKYAEAISDKTQDWRAKQEEIAPSSTKLTTMIGLPASFALAGAIGSYFKFVGDTNTKGYVEATVRGHTEKALFKYGDKEFFKGGRLKRWSIGGALLGLALEAPFLPGALLTGDRSDKLKAVYSGQEEVPVYANRWWGGGGGPWEGGKIKYFRPSLVNVFMNDTETKSIYGDADTKASVNPFLHPFDYLRNPYRKEEITDKDRPYPIWGMDISTGNILGKTFERTAGQIIKPDKLNPRFAEAVASGEIQQNPDGSYDYPRNLSKGDKSLIEEGKLLSPPSARNDINLESAKWGYKAFKDFIGIKGFTLEQVQEALGIDLDTIDNTQLARSGEIDNAARSFAELNLNGMLGLGEAQRRFLPTTAGAIQKRVNPMKNQMPDWLPSNDQSYFVDFGTGDPYKKIELGYARLPGKGYETLHPELKGLDAKDYPDIYKYKILSDVALGSNEYYRYKKIANDRARNGELSEQEAKIYNQVRSQEDARAKNKEFFEYKTDEQLKELGTVKGGLARYWEFLAHDISELPHEKLSIVRPGSKFIHQRTAIEDYKTTQLDTGDAGMWNKPYEHYLSPFLTQVEGEVGVTRRPSKTEGRYEVDDYFDKMQYMKYRNLYKEAQSEGNKRDANTYKREYEKTLQGSLASPLSSSKDVLYSFIALPKRERDYFSSFINADENQRQEIEKLVPSKIGALYQELWKRKDVIADSYDPETGAIDKEKADKAMYLQNQEETQVLAKENKAAYNSYKSNKDLQKQGSFKEYLADIDAQKYIADRTGLPGKQFIGWDPRIDLKDVKLRTLSIGGDDLYDYGFYKTDIQNVRRVIAVMQDQEVATKLSQIKAGIKDKKALESEVSQNLLKNDMKPDVVIINKTNADEGSFNINVTEENES